MTAPPPENRPVWVEATVALYAALLRDRVHFAQTAYGDGEWRCILGPSYYPQTNANSEAFSPTIGLALANTLLNPTGQWCCIWPRRSRAASEIRGLAERWILEHAARVHWLPHRTLGWANIEGQARPLFEAMRTRRVVLVGPEHLTRLPEAVFTPRAFVRVTTTNASATWQETCEQVTTVLEPDDLVILCAGMAATLMVHQLWGAFRGDATFIDVGAMLDPYCGVNSRGRYRAPEWPAAMAQNLGVA